MTYVLVCSLCFRTKQELTLKSEPSGIGRTGYTLRHLIGLIGQVVNLNNQVL